jgi:hypothetical protein
MPHYLTHSFTHQVCKFGNCSWEKKEERGTFLSVGYSLVFWFIVLALYWVSILRKFCWVFSPMRVSQDKCCVSCDCVSLSDPTYAIVI